MKPFPAILLTLAIAWVGDGLQHRLGDYVPNFLVMLPVVVGTSIWMAIDSEKIHLLNYKSGISVKPRALFVCSCLLWIVAFPWYLIVRGRILSGRAELKAAPATGQ